MTKIKTKLIYTPKLANIKKLSAKSFLIYDKELLNFPQIKNWILKQPLKYGVNAGESLKELSVFSKHIEVISSLTSRVSPRELEIISLGGGSVGDFSGFVASVYKRGVALIHIPTTWLSAMDSAHGGKNALNIRSIKNQLGTFYFPKKIFLIGDVLKNQPSIRAEEAFGEFFKMALLDRKLWVKTLKFKNYDSETLWRILPDLIEAKYKVVRRDPFEQKGHRQILNLGHTLGHVFESYFKLPHGVAINYGLFFALMFSRREGFLTDRSLEQILGHPQASKLLNPKKLWPKGERQLKSFEKLLLEDKKKNTSKKVFFIFINGPGRVQRKSILIQDLMKEILKQRK